MRCSFSSYDWTSSYDNAYWTITSDLDIDHMVPLAAAWDSGARNWTTSRRQSYANDLGDSRPLVAVTDNVNQAKGDQDPATWMPSYSSARCRYINEWVATKIRWRLTAGRRSPSSPPLRRLGRPLHHGRGGRPHHSEYRHPGPCGVAAGASVTR